MRVLIIGTGYVGLISGLCYSQIGHHVLCVDVDSEKISSLQNGIPTIYEKGLRDILGEQLSAGRIEFSNFIPTTALFDIAIISVGTPSTTDGTADLTGVFKAVEELATKLKKGATIAIKSTVPVGTAKKVADMCRGFGRGDLSIVSLPEFLREGSAMKDAMYPYRLIFGVRDSNSEGRLRELHGGMEAPIVVCSCETAELIKYASNAFLATKISFINEIANVSERVGADVSQVAYAMGLDPRIGSSFLRPGLGYGGSCFPKDVRALACIAGNVEYEFQLLKAVIEVNRLQRLEPLIRLREWLGGFSGKCITLLGVAFKPGTDDVRESPALDLAVAIQDEGGVVRLCDPVVRSACLANGQIVNVSDDAYMSLRDSDAAILVTEWDEFVSLDWKHAYSLMRSPFLFDGRNVLRPSELRRIGFMLANYGKLSDLFPTPDTLHEQLSILK